MKWILYLLTGLSERIYPEFDIEFIAPHWLLIIAILLVSAYLLFMVLEMKESGLKGGRKLTILFLSLSVAILFLFIAALPQATFYRVKMKNLNALFLLDESLSMKLPADGGSRCEWVRDFIMERKSTIKDLNRYFSIDFYGWGDDETFLGRIKRGNYSFSSLKKILDNYRCHERRSDLLGALSKVSVSKKYSWVVVLTDGVVDEKVHSSIPLYVVYPPESKMEDISITGIDVPELAYVRSPVDVKLKVYSGFENMVKRVLNIYEDGKLIKSQILNISPGEDKYQVELRPNFTGQHIYTFLISPDGEKFPQNNSSSIILNVLLDKIRVLHIVGRPTWDSRFLRLYLKNDPRIDLVSFTILRSNNDDPMASEDELSLIPFPAETLFSDELNNFDVLILQNFDYASYFMFYTFELLRSIKKFVVERGGGLVLVGGELSFSEGDYQNTPIDEVMPVRILPYHNEIYPGKVKLQLTEEGAMSPITSLGLSPEDAKNLWNSLKPVDGENLVGGLRKNSVPLLVDRKSGNVVVAARNVGRGRTLSIATDSLWEMAFRNPEREDLRRGYFQFWKRAIRWLIKDESFKQIRVTLNPTIAFPGESVKITIRAFQSDFKPIQRKDLQVRVVKRNNKKIEHPELSGSNGIYSSIVTFTTPGSYIVTVSFSRGSITIGDSALELVKDPYAEEIRKVRIDKSRISGREISSLDPDLLMRKVIFSPSSRMIVGEKVVPLWDKMVLLLLLSLLFIFLWGVRRRSGFL